MLIDASTYAGHWPFRMLKDNKVQDVCDNAEKNGITHIVIASLNAIFYKDAFDGNRELMEEIKACKTNVKILPLAVVNPTYTGWEKYARQAIKEGFCGFEICPQYHGYSIRPSFKGYYRIHPAAEVLKLAKELGVPVRICVGFENFRQRHWMDVPADITGDELYALFSEIPGTSAIITCAGVASLGEGMRGYIKRHDNIFFDISRLEGHVSCAAKDAVEFAGCEHLCFGTLAPFHYVQVNMVKLRYIKEFKDNGLEDNIKKIFKTCI